MLANYIPSFIVQPLQFLLTYLAAHVGLNLGFIGLRPDTFGHICLTNIGPLGYTSAFAPLPTPLQVMACICTGAIKKRPIVEEDGQMKIAHIMSAIGTGDHRYGDAATLTPFFRTLRGYLEDPENFDEK